MSLLRAAAGPAGLLLLIALAALVSRPLMPIDETRYVGVAWEMWFSGDHLVMLKNGEPYSHKPPMLFWLINLGWNLFGVNEAWPRLVSLLASWGGLLLTAALARRLWPGDARGESAALWILASTGLWMLSSTLVMFDVPLAVCVLSGLLGILMAADGAMLRGFLLLALAIGLGILTKGPVVLLHLLPPALLAPWWRPGLDWRRWYGGLGLAVLGGALLALTWAVPAAIRGGEAYRNAIFWGQTANRMVKSFAHQRPLWWYLPLLPALLFPWLLWPALWRAALDRRRQSGLDSGLRFCLSWAAPVFVAFSFISGKQVHYLVPLMPAFALAAGRLTARIEGASLAVPAGLFAVAGAVMSYFALAGMPGKSGAWEAVPLWPGLLVMLLAALAFWQGGRPQRWMPALAWLSAGSYALLHLYIADHAFARFTVEPLATTVRHWQERGAAVANLGRYHDQFQFAGRLRQPLTELTAANVTPWLTQHPDGIVVAYLDAKRDKSEPREFLARQPFRGKQAYLMTVDQARASGILGAIPASNQDEE